jgi:hypothetical protein
MFGDYEKGVARRVPQLKTDQASLKAGHKTTHLHPTTKEDLANATSSNLLFPNTYTANFTGSMT